MNTLKPVEVLTAAGFSVQGRIMDGRSWESGRR